MRNANCSICSCCLDLFPRLDSGTPELDDFGPAGSFESSTARLPLELGASDMIMATAELAYNSEDHVVR